MSFPVMQLFNDSFSLSWSLSNKAGQGDEDKGRTCVESSVLRDLIVTSTTQLGHGISFPVCSVSFLEKF